MKLKLIKSLLAGVLVTVAIPAHAVTWKQWNHGVGNGLWYAKTDTQLSYDEAKAAAESLGGQLAVIQGVKEMDFIRRTFGYNEQFWIGLSFDSGQGGYQWANGNPLSYTYWRYDFNKNPDTDTGVVMNAPQANPLWGMTTGYWLNKSSQEQFFGIVKRETNPQGNIPLPTDPPTKPIPSVPEPATFGVLALLAAGAELLRRKLGLEY